MTETGPSAVEPGDAEFSGSQPRAVIEAIQRRHARRAAGDYGNDGRKLGLVMEGGSLRAACSAGGAAVLAHLGYSDVFDEVYATSASVMNACYFITNQPGTGISTYFDNCTTTSFLNPLRFWKIVDVDYIFDHVAVHEKPLNLTRLRNSPTRLYVAVTEWETGQGLFIDVKTSNTPILQTLKASAALPVFYNRRVSVEGRACIDGGLAIPFGLQQALQNGCSDVLVLSTRPSSYADSPAGWFDRFVFDVLCARGNRRISRAFREKHLRSREARRLALGQGSPTPKANIATICVHESETVGRMTKSRVALRAAALRYGRTTLRIFGRDPACWALPTPETDAVLGTTLAAESVSEG